MTTDKSSKLINDLKSIPSPVFYIFAAVALFSAFFVIGFNARGVLTALFLLGLVACASGDINKGIVPDLVPLFIAVLGIINIIFVEGISVQNLIIHLIGAVCISVPMLVISILIKGAFGGGDIKLMAAAGLFLGWKYVAAGAFIGMFISGGYGIYLIIFKKAGKKAKVKLAPFLAYGLAMAALFSEQIDAFWMLRS